MKNYSVALKVLDKDHHAPVGYKEINCHLIIDVKMDLYRKARYLSEGNINDPPSCMTYENTYSRYSVRLAFLVEALNDLYILARDIHNAYLNASKKRIFYAGDEWKSGQGKVVVIFRSIYL